MARLSRGLFRLSGGKHISNPVTAHLDKRQADVSAALLYSLQNWVCVLLLRKGCLHFLRAARNCQLLRPDCCEVWMSIQLLQAKTFISSALCPTSLPFVPRMLFLMGRWKWLALPPHEMGGGTDPASLFFLLCLQLAMCTTVFWLPLSCQE